MMYSEHAYAIRYFIGNLENSGTLLQDNKFCDLQILSIFSFLRFYFVILFFTVSLAYGHNPSIL